MFAFPPDDSGYHPLSREFTLTESRGELAVVWELAAAAQRGSMAGYGARTLAAAWDPGNDGGL
jgi:hypothetical protein